jgi:hypothetical protein
MTSSDYSLYRIKTNSSGYPDIACFTRDFETYFQVKTETFVNELYRQVWIENVISSDFI